MSFAQDLRYAARGLRRQPSFVATTVLTLAVGLGLATVAFTVFNAYVLRPFAVRDPAGLHQIVWRTPDDGGQQFRWRDYQEIRTRGDLFDAVVAEHTRFVSAEGRPLGAALVSDNYFTALGPPVALGRTLGPADARDGHDAVVLSHQAWSRLLGSDPDIVGRAIELNGRPFTVVGVTAAPFTGIGDAPRDVWMLLSAYAPLGAPDLIGAAQPREFSLVGRLRDGVTAARAEAALTPMMSSMLGLDRQVRAEVRLHSSPNPLTLELLAILSPVVAAFALVLVTACANVSNVMLARAIQRHREIAVRLSIGASRARIVRQLLTEGLLVALLAGLGGLLLASWILGVATVVFFSTLPPSVAALLRIEPLALDQRVFLFALAATGVTTLLFALVPALQASRLTLTDALRGQDGGARGSMLRSALVIGQVAVSLVLVVTAVTLARNGSAVGSLALGYDTNDVISINVRDDSEGLVSRLAAVLAADPRVAELAVTGGNPLFVRVRAVAAAPADSASTAIPTRYTFVSPEYFSLLRIAIDQGRGFLPYEAQSSAPVAIVSRATAQTLWPGDDPIGKGIRLERANGRPVDDLPEFARLTVVGTVRDVVSGLVVDGLDDGHIYLPTHVGDARATALLMRGRAPSDVTPETLQDIMRPLDIDPQVFEALPLDEMRQLQTYPFVAASWVGSFLGFVALVLSVSGLYGVLTFTISQRTREIGIRMALGATAGAIVRLVLRQSARLAGVGAIAGLFVAFGALRTLSAFIRFERLSLLDAAAFVAAATLVLVATAAAAYAPARRATRIDPAETLRADT
jgi:predicted permease